MTVLSERVTVSARRPPVLFDGGVPFSPRRYVATEVGLAVALPVVVLTLDQPAREDQVMFCPAVPETYFGAAYFHAGVPT